MTVPFPHHPDQDNVFPFPDRHQEERPVPIGQMIAQRDIDREETAKAAGLPFVGAMEHDGLGADPVPDLDAEVEKLAAEVAAMRSRLNYLRGAVEPHSLAGSVLGLIGNSAEEIRTQIRPLREALKDDGGEAA